MGSKRLIRAAIDYALDRKRRSVTLVHKGNIQKFTEGAFLDWGYELVREEFSDVAVGWDDCGGDPGDKLLVKDTIADITLQQVLTRPSDFDVIATTNLNGDYLSDALAAQVGGIGIAPGANINYVTGHGIFEATHGTAPKYAGQDKVNPGSVLLSGVLMFEHIGWTNAAADIVHALEATIADKVVTYDFARLMDGRHRGQVLRVRRRHRRPPLTHAARPPLGPASRKGPPPPWHKPPVHVTVTGAGGQIGYSILFRIASGQLLGEDQPIVLRLLEIEPAMQVLEGVVHGDRRLRLPPRARHRRHLGPQDRLRRHVVGAPRRLGAAQGGHGARRPAQRERRHLQAAGPGHRRERRLRRPHPRRGQPLQHQLPHRPAPTRPRCRPTAGSP